MNMSDLRPARDFALQFGVKGVVYGRAGSGKTPISGIGAPRPLMLATEPGLLTMKQSDIPTWTAFSVPRIKEFFEWFLNSNETANFDTLIVDSLSQLAETIVNEKLAGTSKAGNQVNGKKAYGEMAFEVMQWIVKCYFKPAKHIIWLAKLDKQEVNGLIYHRPYFPGQALSTQVPHYSDLIMCLDNYMSVPGSTETYTKAFLCKEQYDRMARDRSGNLDEYEPLNMGHIIGKCMR